MKKILVVSHCILNTASKVEQDEKELANEYRLKDQLMHLVLEQNVQLFQLPCPEFIMYGSKRWGHVKDQFEHPHFREQCRKMLKPVIMQLEEYLSHPEKFHVIGIVSVEGSPSCGIRLTCTGDWGGEMDSDIGAIRDTLSMQEEPGAFMEILNEELKNRSMDVSIITMEEAITALS